ncbi:lipopolysaccharide biosynthesis protein [Mucilaginibacter gotjawali]|uniref:O-antigen/teichoic acid export membrane protein n=2 Tax=Mucilaginibacter gotjawali TaxID=1550579 RepID=A0A839SFD3_9SPHI|nr:oligosaccharide flippase family protein [Mucilaginibacter gotjawali]MBB3056268.1 O-antigen/teichoic acid export membrane protein [Mucilaginibacter gotjawali]BAU54971.1 Polysaccharide biosynthesis protein [Mucilaginibacter gotjawali]
MQFLKKLVNKHTLSLASNAVMPVVSMVTVSLLARNLTERDLGYWILFLITFTIANFFRSGFLQTSLVKFYSGASEERATTVVGSAWFMGLILTTALAVISFLTYLLGSNPSLEITVKWFAIIFFSTLPSSIALWVLQAEERFDRIFFLQLIHPATFFLSIVGLILIHHTSFQYVIYAYCISAMLTSIISIITGWAKVASIRHKSTECVKELVNFGKYSVGTSISSYLLRGSDTFIIKYMFVDPSFVAIYYLPQRLMEVIEIPLRSFIATALPAMSAAVQRNEKSHMTYIMKKYAGILTILLIPVSIVTFICADFIIEIIGGHKFVPTEAASVFRIFLCFAVLLPVDRFFGITLDILNKPHLNLVKVVLMLVVNIAGDFIGIYFTHSLYGVALASIASFIVGVIYGYWVLKKNLNFKIGDILYLGFTETKLLASTLISRIRGGNN